MYIQRLYILKMCYSIYSLMIVLGFFKSACFKNAECENVIIFLFISWVLCRKAVNTVKHKIFIIMQGSTQTSMPG